MATNPMQRKARNSFLLGTFLTLIVMGAVVGLLAWQLKLKIDKENSDKLAQTSVIVLKQSVKSGQVITSEMLTSKTVNKTDVPSNATGDAQTILNDCALRDKAGNDISVKTEQDSTGSVVNKYYLTINSGTFELIQEDGNDNYYYMDKNNQKQYVEMDTVPIVAKVNMETNTILTPELVSKEDSQVTADMRKQEYNMLVLPSDLSTGDYVDVRFMLPTGQDYIVISRKEVEVPNVGGTDSTDTIWMNLSESETLAMSSAIVEDYQLSGAKLYVTKYTEAGSQKAAIPTYVPNAKVTALIQDNPNIVSSAMAELNARYSDANKSLRNNDINSAVQNSGTEGQTNIKTKMDESITNSKSTRKEYLDSLGGGTTSTTK